VQCLCKLRGRVTNALIVFWLLVGLLGASANVFAGDFNVNVGGINVSPQNSRSQSDPGHRIDKPQTGIGSISVPDSGRSSDSSQGNGPLSDAKPLGGSTIPSTNAGNGGTFPAGSGTLSQPTGNQFCSNNEVTIGETTQGRVHCSNTVRGTFRQ
jgi:hypothetical protein